MGRLNNQLLGAAMSGEPEAIASALDRGADIEARDPERQATALSLAADAGYFDAAKVLVERGAKVDVYDGEGGTPLMSAALWGYTPVARLLVAHGADVHLVDKRGANALDACLLDTGLNTWDAEVALVLYQAMGLTPLDAYKGKTLCEYFKTEPRSLHVIRDGIAAYRQQQIGEVFADFEPDGEVPARVSKAKLPVL